MYPKYDQTQRERAVIWLAWVAVYSVAHVMESESNWDNTDNVLRSVWCKILWMVDFQRSVVICHARSYGCDGVRTSDGLLVIWTETFYFVCAVDESVSERE